jgi:transposase-like protein
MTTPVSYPKVGDYRNDCPFCLTHNAILVERIGTTEEATSYYCRDCKRPFHTVAGRWVVGKVTP